jgi:hypothetical protein
MTAARKPLTFDIDRSPRTHAETRAERTPTEERQQVGARVTKVTYRQLKARAALQGVAVQSLVEQAITEFLAKHPE